jgi:hypothetical protein
LELSEGKHNKLNDRASTIIIFFALGLNQTQFSLLFFLLRQIRIKNLKLLDFWGSFFCVIAECFSIASMQKKEEKEFEEQEK